MTVLFTTFMLIAFLFGTPTPGEEISEAAEESMIFYKISSSDHIVAFIISFILFIPLFIGMSWGLFASGVKRLHDMNASGWWILFMLTPLAIILSGVLIFVRGGGRTPPPRRVD